MAIGILFESKEWSSYYLRDCIATSGIPAKLIDMEQEISHQDELLSCDLIINRVFASAVFRDHGKSLERMPEIIDFLNENNIPMINPGTSHYYEISKQRSTKKLADNRISVPKVYGVFSPDQIRKPAEVRLDYPCIVKPDCGGRTNYTFIVNDHKELAECMNGVPDIKFIAEEYINPEFGFITRIEVIGDECALIMKRSIADNGLSTYHLGSTFTHYDDCSSHIKKTAVDAMELLGIKTGSLDIIENHNGFFIIDVNSVSNVSEDNTEMFDFDLMKETAAYIVKRYHELS